MLTYCKLRDGSWGIKGEGLTEGKTVTVTTKAGVTKQVQVGKVLFTKDAFSIAAISKPKEETRDCWECGRSFTYSFCTENKGDWGEPWCGC